MKRVHFIGLSTALLSVAPAVHAGPTPPPPPAPEQKAAAPEPSPAATTPGPATPAGTPAAPASTAPPVLVAVLPARIEFIAYVPVEKAADQLDLDLRVEAVLPHNCGDKFLGLLRRGGVKPEAPDEYDVIVSRDATGECKKDAVRVGARSAIRVRVADGKTREIVVGDHTVKVARKGKDVTVNGDGPAGDVPGAPPTGRPSVFVTGDVVAAKALSATRTKESPWIVAAEVVVKAKWPACAAAPVGLLGRGDASTHYALTRFLPIARAAQDENCKAAPPRTDRVNVSVKVPTKAAEQSITVGNVAVAIKPAG